MAKHKPKKDPAKTLPVREFFGEYFEPIIAHHDEEPRMTNLACLMELADYEAKSLRFDGWGPEQKTRQKKSWVHVPVPMMSRRHFQGTSSSIERGVCSKASRHFLDGFFLRLRTCPWSMITSCSYVTPSMRIEPKEIFRSA
jgi:hypothetical protein